MLTSTNAINRSFDNINFIKIIRGEMFFDKTSAYKVNIALIFDFSTLITFIFFGITCHETLEIGALIVDSQGLQLWKKQIFLRPI